VPVPGSGADFSSRALQFLVKRCYYSALSRDVDDDAQDAPQPVITYGIFRTFEKMEVARQVG
jgi:hypothetical protein